MKKNIKNILIFLFVVTTFVFAQDEFEGPSEFEYNQSRFQAFYLYLNGPLFILFFNSNIILLIFQSHL